MKESPLSPEVPGDTVNLYLKVDRCQLVFLNGVIESYDDLAVIRTLDAAKGIVVIMVTPAREQVVLRLLASLAGELSLEYLDPAGETLDAYREQIYGLA